MCNRKYRPGELVKIANRNEDGKENGHTFVWAGTVLDPAVWHGHGLLPTDRKIFSGTAGLYVKATRRGHRVNRHVVLFGEDLVLVDYYNLDEDFKP